MLRAAILALFLVGSGYADLFVDERAKQETCERRCGEEYPLHTYAQPEHLSACERGCRFFALVRISQTDPDGKQVAGKTDDGEHACEKACTEAYPQPQGSDEKSLKYHCDVGCKNGGEVHEVKKQAIEQELHFRDPLMEQLVAQLQHDDLFNSRPFQIMNQMMNEMMQQMNQALSMTFSSFGYDGQRDGHETKTSDLSLSSSASGPRRIVIGQPGVLVIRTSHGRPSSGSVLPDMDDPFEELRGSNTRFMDSDPFPKVKTAKVVKEEVPKHGSSDWLECVSRKAGVPRWLLLTSIFLCSLMFVWFCFAATGPVPEQRVYAISASPPAYPCKQSWSEIPYVCPAYDKVAMEKMAEDAEKNGDLACLINNDQEPGPLPAKIHFEKA